MTVNEIDASSREYFTALDRLVIIALRDHGPAGRRLLTERVRHRVTWRSLHRLEALGITTKRVDADGQGFVFALTDNGRHVAERIA